MAPAPFTTSSAGWPMRTSVLCQRLFVAASILAVPMSVVMWTSCPQACMTPTSLAGSVLRLHRRRVRSAGLFDDRQRVHVGADVDGRPVTVLQHRHDAVGRQPRLVVLTNLLGDRVAELAQPRGDEGAALLLVLRQLRRRMELLVRRHQRRQLLLDHRVELLGEKRHGEEYDDDQDQRTFHARQGSSSVHPVHPVLMCSLMSEGHRQDFQDGQDGQDGDAG